MKKLLLTLLLTSCLSVVGAEQEEQEEQKEVTPSLSAVTTANEVEQFITSLNNWTKKAQNAADSDKQDNKEIYDKFLMGFFDLDNQALYLTRKYRDRYGSLSIRFRTALRDAHQVARERGYHE